MVKTSPDGRFRFVKGASDGVAETAYDTENGLLVGWNELNLRGVSPTEQNSLRRSIDLLQGLRHEHVLGIHSYWDASKAGASERQPRGPSSWKACGGEPSTGGDGERVVFLTTPCTTLEAFVETKVEFLRWRVVKRWSQQLLEALRFLHQQDPPVVHKKLSLSTIYIDPSTSNIFVGGVRDIVPPPPPSLSSSASSAFSSSSTSSSPPSSSSSSSAPVDSATARNLGKHTTASEHGAGSRKSLGDRAWGLVAGGHAARSKDRGNCEEGGQRRRRQEFVAEGGVCDGELAAARDAGEEEEHWTAEARGRAGCARDIRAFATVLIEMVLKRRLDSVLVEDEGFLEMLPVMSGWPSSMADLLRSCRAPVEERPTAEQLLEHDFLEVANGIDDEPVYGDPDVVGAAFAAAGGNSSSHDAAHHAAAMAAAATAAEAAAAAAAAAAPQQQRRASPPPPLFASPHHPHNLAAVPTASSAAAAAAAAAGGGVRGPQTWHTGASSAPGGVGCYRADSAAACGAPWACPAPGYTPSCVSTESPSPSSPSTAPSFGGVPTTPSPPRTGGAAAVRAAAAAGRGAPPFPSQREVFPPLLPPGVGVTPAAYANATAIAARMQPGGQAAQAYATHSAPAWPKPSEDGGTGRSRSVSYPERRHASPAGGGGSALGSSTCFGVPLREDGGSGGGRGVSVASVGSRGRSASEDAVWDMLPSDESQCRRPFSVSAMRGRHGC